MPHAHRFARAGLALAVAALVSFGAGCERSPTSPRPAPVVHRTVTVHATDSLGAPAQFAQVVWKSFDDTLGHVDQRITVADAQGIVREVLTAGPWMVYVQGGLGAQGVAGATFDVPGASRAGADTQLATLRLDAGSVVHGVVTLTGLTNHAGTIVGVVTDNFVAASESTGVWALPLVPIGKWPVRFRHPGFAPKVETVVVATSLSRVSVPDVRLISTLGPTPSAAARR